ncbi:MAG: iron chelate uptake ABC transporter family permease subunit [Actinomyces sp.]|uniref:iron chelate uptake ABC transporter family permease subunit n=1 Tax=Actinomyces sp. TaxID=29317 RepID=UPI0026DB9EEB|nr:iron chelate uptake ABC transporter family permease subunit [Actinomyces sp.]MDO4242901.1 iron chelate uptake ABC transporter family permease subunit [Actinomyces sp.]
MTAVAQPRSAGAFASVRSRRRWWLIYLSVTLAALGCAIGLLAWDNPMEPGSRGFWLIAARRLDAVVAMALVAVSQAMATVAFQTVAGNRIVTPSLLGFESLYRAIHTTTVFLFGISGLAAARTLEVFALQLVIMVCLSLVLYAWLLTSRRASMHALLLIGIVVGAGLGSVSTFMQRLMTPSEFDVLAARLFGSVSNADRDYYPIAVPLVVAVALALYAGSRYLNVLALGRQVSTSLGMEHRRATVLVLVAVSLLMAGSTALVGPMTFLGFLVATIAYQLCETHDHRFILPMAVSLAFLTLTGAYLLMKHVFYAEGIVSVIIELVGGSAFLLIILRKGRL